MNFLKRFLRGGPPATPEYQIYRKIVGQSRRLEFFGEGNFPDSYDGRLNVLTLHMAVVMSAGRELATDDAERLNAERFSQSLFDVMVRDFDTALREEGFTDAGVKRRIKPMVARFYERLKAFTEGLESESSLLEALSEENTLAENKTFALAVSNYAIEFQKMLKNGNYQHIFDGSFNFPPVPTGL